MRRTIGISVYEGIGTRAAIVEDGVLVEYEWEPHGNPTLLGQIHRGEVMKEAKGLGGVFVKTEGGRGILGKSDILAAAIGEGGFVAFPTRRDLCAPVAKLPAPRTPILVQVKREGSGAKDPQLTTDISLPGRRIILRPYRPIRRISKEVASKQKRDALHEILRSIKLPGRAGIILRTAGISARRDELAAELNELSDQWEGLVETASAARAPSLLYKEPDMLERVFRDEIAGRPVDVVVDAPEARDRLEGLAGGRIKIRLHEGGVPLFAALGVEKAMADLYNRELSLPSGGRLVIDYTEALIAADVNSGAGGEEAKSTAIQTNLEAAEELFRQVRLRGLGGLIVCDFIAMKDPHGHRQLEERLQALAQEDRGRVWLSPLNRLGFAAFTRQVQKPIQSRLGLERCPACGGTSLVLDARQAALRLVEALLAERTVRKTVAQVSPQVMAILQRSASFKALKKRFGAKLVLEEAPETAGQHVRLERS